MKNDENVTQNPVNKDAGEKSNLKILTYQEKILKKKGFTKGALITGLIAVILIVAGGLVMHSRYTAEKQMQLNQMEMQKKGFNDQLTARDAEINSWMTTFDEIENDMKTIKEKENLISVKSAGSELSKDKKQQVLADFKYLNKLMEQNRAKIASLNEQLRKSGSSIKGLQTRIASLEASMKQSEEEVSQLKTVLASKEVQIGDLNTKVSGLTTTIAQKDEMLTNQVNEMNKAYVVSGTYKDLKEKGIVVKEGGFLGLGKKEVLAGNFSDNSFSKIDLSSTKTIPVDAKEAKLITDHPSGSYELIRENNKIAYIEIKDANQFWKISKYAVVETK
jgi:predicted  nucleic acid-binding Zn-ribbon protein